MSKTPGTVSKILWHFTGGPEWDIDSNKQKTVLKKSHLAFEILNKIIDDGVVKTSSFSEVSQSLALTMENDGIKTIETHPVCCLADIPIQHLGYHAKRYGKFAIGFHRDFIGPRFNPVFYNPIGSYLNIEIGFLHEVVQNEAPDKLKRALMDMGLAEAPNFRHIFNLVDEIKNDFKASMDLLLSVLAYSKSFTPRTEFDTIYCEREWRSVENFHFDSSAIAMVVLPRRGGFYKRFVEQKPELLRYFSVVAWEDLIEH